MSKLFNGKKVYFFVRWRKKLREGYLGRRFGGAFFVFCKEYSFIEFCAS